MGKGDVIIEDEDPECYKDYDKEAVLKMIRMKANITILVIEKVNEMNVEKGLYYGKEAWSNIELDVLRRSECLCLNCDRMSSCDVAKKLYEICKTNNMAVAITRCGAIVDGELMFKLKGE